MALFFGAYVNPENRRTAEAKALIGRGIELIADVGQLMRLDPEAFERAAVDISEELLTRAALRSIRQIMSKQDARDFAKQLIIELTERFG